MNNTTFFRLSRTRFLIPGIVVILLFAVARCKVNSSVAKNKSKGISTLIVGGGSSHDFNRWYKQADVETLQRDGLAKVNYTGNTDSILYFLPNIDVLYLANNQPINDTKVRQAILDFVNGGKGLVMAHAALWYNWKDWPEYNQQLASGGSRGHDRYGTFDVNILDDSHPVTKGVEKKFTLKDELYYYKPDSTGPGIQVLASASVAGSDKVYPSVFIVKHAKGRVVGLALGHDAESHNIPAYQNLLRNAVTWAAGK